MSIPMNTEDLKKLQQIAEENNKAGDWVYQLVPGISEPIRVDGLTPQDILKTVGSQPVPKK